MIMVILLSLLAILPAIAFGLLALKTKDPKFSKLAKVFLILALIFIFIIVPSFFIGEFITVFQFYNVFVENIAMAGFDQWLTKAIAVAALVVFYFYGIKKVHKKSGKVVIAAFLVAYFILMHFATDFLYKNLTAKAPCGIICFDPFSGHALKKVAPMGESNFVRDNDSAIMLFPANIKIDPITGRPLVDITPEIAEKRCQEIKDDIAKRNKEVADSIAAATKAQADSAALAKASLDKANTANALAQYRGNYLASGIPSGKPNGRFILLIAEMQSDNGSYKYDPVFENQISAELSDNGWSAITGIFKDKFYSDNLADRIAAQDKYLIDKLCLGNFAQKILIVKGQANYTTQTGLTRLSVCSLTSQYYLIDAANGINLISNNASQQGSSNDMNAAGTNAMMKISKLVASEVSKKAI
jgi:hypothetical protein